MALSSIWISYLFWCVFHERTNEWTRKEDELEFVLCMSRFRFLDARFLRDSCLISFLLQKHSRTLGVYCYKASEQSQAVKSLARCIYLEEKRRTICSSSRPRPNLTWSYYLLELKQRRSETSSTSQSDTHKKIEDTKPPFRWLFLNGEYER